MISVTDSVQGSSTADPECLFSSRSAVELPCTLSVTEITGSETFLHLLHGTDRWVGLVHGVHKLVPGDPVSVWLDPRHVYLFDEAGALAAPAAYAMAA